MREVSQSSIKKLKESPAGLDVQLAGASTHPAGLHTHRLAAGDVRSLEQRAGAMPEETDALRDNSGRHNEADEDPANKTCSELH